MFSKWSKSNGNKYSVVATVLLLVAILIASEYMNFGVFHTRVISLLIVLVVSYFIFFASDKKQNNTLMIIATIVFPIAVFGTGMLFIVNPQKADLLAVEDGLVENLSATFLFIGSLFMIAVSVIYARRKERLIAVFALIGTLLFFVIGMEEISWMQRFLERESSEFFLSYNIQNETNLHNLATGLSEKVYYLGGFFLLTILPFMRDKIISIVRKGSNYQRLSRLLPSTWLLVPFISISGFSKWHNFTFAAIFIISFIIGLSVISKNSDNLFVSLGVVISLLAAFSIFVITSTLNYEVTGTRHWFYSEYREMFIALGIMIYSIDQLWSIYRKKDPLKINL